MLFWGEEYVCKILERGRDVGILICFLLMYYVHTPLYVLDLIFFLFVMLTHKAESVWIVMITVWKALTITESLMMNA